MSNEIYQTSSRVDINLDSIHSRITHLYPGSHHDSNKEQFSLDRRHLEPGVDWGLKDRERIEKLNQIERNTSNCNKNDESAPKLVSEQRPWPIQAHQPNRQDMRRDQIDCRESENQATNLTCDADKIENNIINSEVKRENTEPIGHNAVSDTQTVITSTVSKADNPIYSHQNYVPIKTEPFQEFVQKYERPDFNYPPPPSHVQYLNNQNYFYDNYPPQIQHSNVYNTTYNPPAPTPQPQTVPHAIENKPKSSSRSSNSSPTESQLLRLQRHRDSQALRRLNPDYRRAEQEADRQRKRIRRSNPDYRRLENARNSMRNRIRRSDPVYRAAEQKVDAIRKRLKRNDPEYRKKEQERNNIRNRIRRMDPEYREAERIRSANRKRIKRSDPEYRKREQELDRERKKRKKQLKRDQQQNSSNSEELETNQVLSSTQHYQHSTTQNYSSNQSNNSQQPPESKEQEQIQSHPQQQHHHNQQHHHHHHQNHPPTLYQPILPPPSPHNQNSDDLKLKLLKIGERQFPIPPPISHIYSLQRNFMENCGFHPSQLPITHHHHHSHHNLHGANATSAVTAAAVPANRHNFRNFDGKYFN